MGAAEEKKDAYLFFIVVSFKAIIWESTGACPLCFWSSGLVNCFVVTV